MSNYTKEELDSVLAAVSTNQIKRYANNSAFNADTQIQKEKEIDSQIESLESELSHRPSRSLSSEELENVRKERREKREKLNSLRRDKEIVHAKAQALEKAADEYAFIYSAITGEEFEPKRTTERLNERIEYNKEALFELIVKLSKEGPSKESVSGNSDNITETSLMPFIPLPRKERNRVEPETLPEEPKKKKKWWVWPVIIVLLILLALFIFFIFKCNGNDQGETPIGPDTEITSPSGEETTPSESGENGSSSTSNNESTPSETNPSQNTSPSTESEEQSRVHVHREIPISGTTIFIDAYDGYTFIKFPFPITGEFASDILESANKEYREITASSTWSYPEKGEIDLFYRSGFTNDELVLVLDNLEETIIDNIDQATGININRTIPILHQSIDLSLHDGWADVSYPKAITRDEINTAYIRLTEQYPEIASLVTYSITEGGTAVINYPLGLSSDEINSYVDQAEILLNSYMTLLLNGDLTPTIEAINEPIEAIDNSFEIHKHYSLYGENIDVDAYNGYAYVIYPSFVPNSTVEEGIKALSEEYPNIVDYISYRFPKEGVLALDYDRSFTKDEVNFALDKLSQFVSEYVEYVLTTSSEETLPPEESILPPLGTEEDPGLPTESPEELGIDTSLAWLIDRSTVIPLPLRIIAVPGEGVVYYPSYITEKDILDAIDALNNAYPGVYSSLTYKMGEKNQILAYYPSSLTLEEVGLEIERLLDLLTEYIKNIIRENYLKPKVPNSEDLTITSESVLINIPEEITTEDIEKTEITDTTGETESTVPSNNSSSQKSNFNRNEIDISLSPYSLSYTYDTKARSGVFSKYGFTVGLSYRYRINNNFKIGLKSSFNYYLLSGTNKMYWKVPITVVFDGNVKMTDKSEFYGGIGIGAAFTNLTKELDYSLVADAVIGFNFKMSDIITFNVETEGTIDFPFTFMSGKTSQFNIEWHVLKMGLGFRL